MATLLRLSQQCPQIQILCSRAAARGIEGMAPAGESDKLLQQLCPVQNGGQLDLGQGHRLQFLSVPTPRWPDGLVTYDVATRILFTDKLFGAHFCHDALWDDQWQMLDGDRRYYFDCLHAPQAKQVETALARMEHLPAQCYAPGHGPLVRYSLSRFTWDYRQWCQQQTQQCYQVALLYASAYGNTAVLAGAIAQGLIQAGVGVETLNCETASVEQITRALAACDGFIIGSPTLGGHAPVQIQTALGTILSTAETIKLAGVFGSYGWSGEAVDLLEQKLRDANYRLGFEPIRIRFSPDEAAIQQCEAAGIEFAQQLRQQKRQLRQGGSETQSNRTAQAMGRIVNSLCVVTAQSGGAPLGFLTASVAQASFNPPGIMLSLVDDAALADLTQPHQPFVLNILKEGRNLRRHFSNRGAATADAFTQIAHHPAASGCVILDEALAYLECRVSQVLACGDRWLIYGEIAQGEVLSASGSAVVIHRKSASF